MHVGRTKFQDSKNKIIDYRQFHYRIDSEIKCIIIRLVTLRFRACFSNGSPSKNIELKLCFFAISLRTVRAFFDILHFISLENMPFHDAIELAVFIGHEGQIEMNSQLEMRLLSRLVDFVKESNLSRLEHALAFIYLKSWGPNAKEGFSVIKVQGTNYTITV